MFRRWDGQAADANYEWKTLNELGAFLGMVVAAGFIALYAVLSKILLRRDVEPFVFLAHRQVLAAAMMLPLAWCRDGVHAPPREQWSKLAGLGFLFFANIGGFIVGLQLTNAFSVIIMQLSIPGMGLCLNWALGKERPSAAQVIWTVIATLGCLLAVSGTRSASMRDFSRLELSEATAIDVRFVVGICVLLAQCAAFSCFAILQKHVLVACPPFSVVAWTHPTSALFCVLAAIASGQGRALVAPDAYGTPGLLTLVYAAGFGTVRAAGPIGAAGWPGRGERRGFLARSGVVGRKRRVAGRANDHRRARPRRWARSCSWRTRLGGCRRRS